MADGGLGPGRARRRGARRGSPGAAWAGSGSPSPAALAGLAYGALLDLSVMVAYGGEQSLDRYLAISARGVPFNVAHAVGNVALALAAGPALVRMISRYRSRFEFSWRQRGPVRPRGARRRPRVGACVAAACRARRRGSLAPAGQARAGGPAPPGSGSSAPRTPTAASAPRPAAPRAPAITGWAVLGLEAPGATRSTFDAAGARRSTTCARRPAACARPATSSGPSSPSTGRA